MSLLVGRKSKAIIRRMSLPALVVFSIKDTDQEVRYLSFTGPQRQLRCGIEEGVFSDTVQFAVESAGNGLVHIRSCYENYYWVRASRFEPWLLASSPQAERDMSKDECTLFRPRFSAGHVSVSFVHAQSGLNVVMRPATDAHAYNLCVEQAAATDFNFIDFSPFRRIKLPRYIMFLGDNNRYLSARVPQLQLATLHFQTFENPTDRSVGFEIVYTKNGDIRVKSMIFDGFWSAIPVSRQVVVNTSPETNPNDPNTVFEVSRFAPVGVNYVGVALRCRGVDQYCYRILNNTANLVVGMDTPRALEACFRPMHAAHQDKRRVIIESYRHARVRNTILYWRRRILFNSTDVEHEHLFIEPNIPLFTRTTFSSGISYFTGPPAVFNGRMPSVTTSGKLEFSDVASNVNAEWGQNTVTTVHKTYEQELIMPAKTRVEVTVYKNVATYEIPFSYQQIDELPFSGNVTQDLYDGALRLNSEYAIELRIRHSPHSGTKDISQVGVELVAGSGIFEYEGSDVEDGVKKADEPDQGSDAQGDMTPDGSDQEADAFGGINTDASDQVVQEL